jgi:hypothetical protein
MYSYCYKHTPTLHCFGFEFSDFQNFLPCQLYRNIGLFINPLVQNLCLRQQKQLVRFSRSVRYFCMTLTNFDFIKRCSYMSPIWSFMEIRWVRTALYWWKPNRRDEANRRSSRRGERAQNLCLLFEFAVNIFPRLWILLCVIGANDNVCT